MGSSIRVLREADIRRKVQDARRQNDPGVWRSLARELIKHGYTEKSPIVIDCYKNAEILER